MNKYQLTIYSNVNLSETLTERPGS